jgi:DNA-binding SARP family transcriptional activator
MDFRVLGPLEVVAGDCPLALGGSKQRALLAVLLLHANEVVSIDRLIDALWGDSPPDTAHKALQGNVLGLRKALEPDRKPDAAWRTLVTQAPGYLLRVRPGEFDLELFEECTAEGRAALQRGDPARAAALLREALGLWRGPPLADVAFEAFAEAEVSRLEEARLAALEERIEADLALGRQGELVGELESLVAREPLRERLRGQLMLCLYRCGRQADALACYREGREALVEELGIEPGPAVRDLEQRILRQEPSLQAAGPTNDVGEVVLPSLLRQLGERPFVGRVRELGELRQRWQQACSGTPQLVPLAGEAGIGKTRLMAELGRELHGAGALVLYGRCDEEPLVPYKAFIEALRQLVRGSPAAVFGTFPDAMAGELTRLVPEVADRIPGLRGPMAGDPERERYRLFEAVASFVPAASRVRPVALLLDDLHWADRSTVLLFKHLVRETRDAPLLVLAAYREGAVGRDHPLQQALADLHRDQEFERIALGGLDEDEVAELVATWRGVDADPALARSLHERTEGHPFFLLELLRHADEASTAAVPEGVRDLVRRRVDTLGEPARRMLSVAAVIGTSFGWDLLERTAELPTDELQDGLDEAAEAVLIQEEGSAFGRYRFSHALVRETLYQDLSTTRRSRLHRRVGEALEALSSADAPEVLPALALHFLAAQQAGDLDKAIDYSLRAAGRAVAQLAFEEAVDHLEVALAAWRDTGGSDRRREFQLLYELGRARMLGGDRRHARQALEAAAALAREIGSAELLADSALAVGGDFLWGQGIVDRPLIELLEEAFESLSRASADDGRRARLLARLSAEMHWADPGRAPAIGNEAIELARRAGDSGALAYALSAGVITWSPGTAQQRLAAGHEIARLAQRASDRELTLHAHLARYISLFELGELDGALEELAGFERIAGELRQPAYLVWCTAFRGTHASIEGRLQDSEPLALEAIEIAQRIGDANALANFGGQLLPIRREQLRLAELVPVVADLAQQHGEHMPVWRCVLAWLHAHQGDEARARAIFDELAADRFAGVPPNMQWTAAMIFLSEVCALLEDAASATTLYALQRPYADLNQVSGLGVHSGGAISRYLGMLATVMGRYDEATAHFEHALALNRALRADLYVAHTQCNYARMLLRRDGRGDRDAALRLVNDAMACAQHLHLGRVEQLAESLAREAASESPT